MSQSNGAPAPSPSSARAPVAVVGMSARFGGAPDLQAFWRLTVEGRHAFVPVPADRWPHAAYYDENRRATDRTYAPAGAFVDGVREFPALHLGIPPRRVEVMDPQQRMAIELALEAIADAGATPAKMPRRTGVFVGVTASEFRILLSSRILVGLLATGFLGKAPDTEGLAGAVENVVPSRPFTAPGALANMIAAAVAQELDLNGPAYTVDAACASGMMAVADAVAQLRAGTIDAAVAGGVYLQLSPENYVAFSRIGAISGAGVCRPFDARADGFVQGDGGAALILKRLDDALRDGDRVYAVLHGIATNNDGRGDGPMAPRREGQVAVIRDAWQDAGLDPALLGYAEAHGTGTDVGDQIELSGLREALAGARGVALGSAKANIGHTMSTAGVAGLVRAALAIHHRTLPPLANFESAKPELGLDRGDFRIPTAAEPWSRDRRVACVSSFGFGGTNGHAVLGEAPPAAVPAADQLELVRLSAGAEADLRRSAEALADELDAHPAPVAAVARAWNARPALRHRAAIVAGTTADLVARLRALAAGERAAGLVTGEAPAEPAKVAFLFPGQGAQRVGMLRALAGRFPAVAGALAQAEADVADLLPTPLRGVLWADPSDPAEEQLAFTANCQPALVASGLACAALLAQVGVTPVAVGGHSLGEFAAYAVAGVLTPTAAMRYAARRGRAMADLPGDRGAMAAILAPADTVRELLAATGAPGVVVANENHPRQTVVSGPTGGVAAVVAAGKAAGLDAKELRVSHAFHSPIFAGLDPKPWRADLGISAPRAGVTAASGIADAAPTTADDVVAVLDRHAVSPVRMGPLLAQARAAGADVFVQVGAGGPLASFARQGVEARAVVTLAGMDDADGGRSALEGLGLLWTLGVALDTTPITGPALPASVPPIRLPKETYWPVTDRAQPALKLVGAATPQAAAAPAATPAPAEAAPASGGPDEVYDRVAAVVAKVSSYPLAALRKDQVLVEDLGFDSLMMADLATGLAEAFPGLGGLPQELLLERPTVAALAAHVARARTGEAAPTDDDAPLLAYRPVWRPCPLPEGAKTTNPTPLAGKLVLVTGDRDPEVVAALKQAGAAVTRRIQANVELVVSPAPFEDPAPVHAVVAGEVEVPDRGRLLARVVEDLVREGCRPGVAVLCREDDPWAGGELGVVRAVAREWPDRLAKAVRFSGIDPAFRAARLVQELASSDRTVDVRWTPEGRAVAGQEPVAAPAEAWDPAGKRIAVTGGTRGLGAKLVERLRAAGAHVVALGRSQADVADRAGLVAALAGQGPFDLAIHAAGVLADGPIGQVEPVAADRARTTKLLGLLNLMAATRAPKILATGSWAGRFGNRHQLHYAAGNAAMATLAEFVPGLVVAELPPWSTSDMVSTIPAAIQAAMRAEGIDFTGDDAGLTALAEDLARPGGAVVHGRRVPWWNRNRVVEETLSVDSHPALADHAIEGVPVLPLAWATDLLARAADLPAPFEVADVTLYAGVTVREPVRLEVVSRGDRVELRSGGKLHYRATVRPLAALPEAPAPAPGGAPPTLDARAFYAKKLTFHGKLFQGLDRIEAVGATFAKGRVRCARVTDFVPESRATRWHVDPLALDSAFQMAAVVAWERFGRAGTPVALGSLAVLEPFGAGPLSVEATFPAEEPAGDRFEAGFVFRSGDRVVAIARGAVANLVRKAGEKPTFVPKPEWTDPGLWPEVRDLEQRLEAATLLGIPNPYFHVHEGTARNTTVVGGRTLVNFSSYNYLGLSGDPRVLDEVDRAVRRYGTSVSASRVASGERPFHHELEGELAAAQGVEDALVFTAGHMTNVNVVGHLMKPADLVLHDELIHDSLLQGIKLSGAGRRAFRHDDPEHLEKLLAELRPHHQKCLVIVEGVYSMDGDVCRLPAYVALKKKYGAMLLVDEAHSFGVLGPRGCGAGEHFRNEVDPREVDLWMGTLSKSLASCGGWIAGSKTLIRYLRYTAPGFVYSAGITPANGTAALASLRLMLAEPWRVAKLQANARRFQKALAARGVDTGPAKGGSAVVPAITGNSMHALLLSARLREQGINVQPIVYPAVADDAARLRFFLSSTHEDAELDRTAEAVATTLASLRAEFPAS